MKGAIISRVNPVRDWERIPSANDLRVGDRENRGDKAKAVGLIAR